MKVPARAEELYTSSLFKKSRLYARQVSDRWFIMSAKHGLLPPDKIVEPYNLSLSYIPVKKRYLWVEKIYDQLSESVPSIQKVILLGGAEYTDALKHKLLSNGLNVDTPLARLSLGKRLS